MELAGLEPATSWVRSRSYCLVVSSRVHKMPAYGGVRVSVQSSAWAGVLGESGEGVAAGVGGEEVGEVFDQRAALEAAGGGC
jgi:hypothetical protein